MEKPITTIEDLAALIQRTMASKEDIQGVHVRLDGIDSRLDRIEHLLLAEQKREIEDRETVRYLTRRFAIAVPEETFRLW